MKIFPKLSDTTKVVSHMKWVKSTDIDNNIWTEDFGNVLNPFLLILN